MSVIDVTSINKWDASSQIPLVRHSGGVYWLAEICPCCHLLFLPSSLWYFLWKYYKRIKSSIYDTVYFKKFIIYPKISFQCLTLFPTRMCNVTAWRHTRLRNHWLIALVMAGAEGEVSILRSPGIAALPISLLSMGGVCGRNLTAGKILFTERQTCSLYLVLWLLKEGTSRIHVFWRVNKNSSGIVFFFFFFAPKLSRICTICVVRGKFTLSEESNILDHSLTANHPITIENFKILASCDRYIWP